MDLAFLFSTSFTVGRFVLKPGNGGFTRCITSVVLRWIAGGLAGIIWGMQCNAIRCKDPPHRVPSLGTVCVAVSDAESVPHACLLRFAPWCMTHSYTGSCCGWASMACRVWACCLCVLGLSCLGPGGGPGKNGGSCVGSECGGDRPPSARRPLSGGRQPLTLFQRNLAVG